MMRDATKVLILATLAVCAPFSAGKEEECALVQKRVEVHSPGGGLFDEEDSAATGAGACECLNWKETYEANLVSCGQGFEYTSGFPMDHTDPDSIFQQSVDNVLQLDKKILSPAMEEPYCQGFFTKIDDNSCAKVAMIRTKEHWTGKNWCYVSSECTELRGGAEVPGTQLKAKFCEKGQDALLADKEPEELYAFSKKMDVDAEYMFKLSYQLEKGIMYDDPKIQMLYLPIVGEGPDPEDMGLVLSQTDFARKIIVQAVVNSNEFTILDETGHKDAGFGTDDIKDRVILKGHKRWVMDGPDAEKYGHVMFGLKCEKGC